MTIEIDDAGTGEIVSSAFIGIYRIETGELLLKEIPVHLFDEYGWDMKLPKFKAVDLILEGLKELEYNKNESIHICQGNFFDYVRSSFRDNKISFENCKNASTTSDFILGERSTPACLTNDDICILSNNSANGFSLTIRLLNSVKSPSVYCPILYNLSETMISITASPRNSNL